MAVDTSALPKLEAVPKPGSTDLRRALISLALTPVGLLASVGAGLFMSGLLGLPIFARADEYSASAAQEWLLGSVTTILALGAPAVAVVFAVRGLRAGHRRGKLVLALAVLVLAVCAAGPPVSNWLTERQYEQSQENLGPIPPDWVVVFGPEDQASYDFDQPEIITGPDGQVTAATTRWTTGRTPAQACTDFRQAFEGFVGPAVTEPPGAGESCRLSAGNGEFTAVVTQPGGDGGALIVVTQRSPAEMMG